MNPNRFAQEIAKKYAVTTEEKIATPGRYYGQHFSAPYFHALATNGFALREYGATAILHLSESEAKPFNLGDAMYAVVHEASNGAVIVDFLS